MFLWRYSLPIIFLSYLISINHIHADGPVGEHVNALQDHLKEYRSEVIWLIDQVTGIVEKYENSGVESAKPELVVDHWEAVKFHSAIESNYMPLYASIWQGLFAVRTAIENEQPVEMIRAELTSLEEVLWQSLGAIKLAAQLQEQGLLEKTQTREGITPSAILIEIKQRLDRALAKYAEKLADDALVIVQETYLTRFEQIERILIEQDAALVEDLEIDFNVNLPNAIQNGVGVDGVRAIILDMQIKLNQARAYLKKA
ncbi:MAG: hypothetical protein ACJ0Q6_01775 [Candidatus Azotimanducaceae bacterium]|uniref:Uncharacterized protein n=1 Tax=OM182 bacterium TaxID=2510334 RepID=A0A520RZ39_9GAMM|nr:hypothetical protein [Gammaproteobacteria bacterium]OUV68128.1 MAG: hypothetical protein CBC93_02020 [Gammaproteobacteria bacterium TMED133]RZO75461.1 MAG: hypothetical protein EVA68_06950 [OM182 bacterium]